MTEIDEDEAVLVTDQANDPETAQTEVAGGENHPAAPDVTRLRADLFKARKDLRMREVELEASQGLGCQTMERLRDEHDRALRAIADLENYKKRAAKEREEQLKFGQERILRDFLPVIDNLDRALAHATSPAEFDSLLAGLKMTKKLFEDTLAHFGVKGIDSLNKPFDPHFHEAIQTVDTDLPAGTVVQEIVRGYLLNERLLRPAAVVVAKNNKKDCSTA